MRVKLPPVFLSTLIVTISRFITVSFPSISKPSRSNTLLSRKSFVHHLTGSTLLPDSSPARTPDIPIYYLRPWSSSHTITLCDFSFAEQFFLGPFTISYSLKVPRNRDMVGFHALIPFSHFREIHSVVHR